VGVKEKFHLREQICCNAPSLVSLLGKCLQHFMLAEPKFSWDICSSQCMLSAAYQKPPRQISEEEISLEVSRPFSVKPAVYMQGRILRLLTAMLC